jgi:hypothetical protein
MADDTNNDQPPPAIPPQQSGGQQPPPFRPRQALPPYVDAPTWEPPPRRNNVLYNTQPPFVPPPMPPAPATVELTGRITVSKRTSATINASPAAVASTERRFSGNIDGFRDAARTLAAEFVAQIDEMQRSRPNDEAGLAAYEQLMAFFDRMATGLAQLADALDEATKSDAENQPIFLGKAGKIADWLHAATMEFLEKHRTTVVEIPVRIGFLGVGLVFLHSLGADSVAALTALTPLVTLQGGSKKDTKPD